jgi:Transient receptor potential (TRP) ion channel
LTWGAYNVWHRARRSIALHHNPAYILFSDNAILNKWGFLYVQFKATMYFFIIVILLHTLAKALFIAFGQRHGTVQAVGLLVLELVLLVAICIMRPYMDKKTNGVNISIAVVNFLNVILLLFFSNIFGVPVSLPGTIPSLSARFIIQY